MQPSYKKLQCKYIIQWATRGGQDSPAFLYSAVQYSIFSSVTRRILVSLLMFFIRAKRVSNCYISEKKICACVRLILVLVGNKICACVRLILVLVRYVLCTRYVCTWYQPPEIYTYVRYVPDTYVPGISRQKSICTYQVRYAPPVDAHV